LIGAPILDQLQVVGTIAKPFNATQLATQLTELMGWDNV
jgi:hypothetical protein